MKMDMKEIMKQAQQMQEAMAAKQKELAALVFEASAGGGMVTARVNGRHELVGIAVDRSIVSADDVEMLQDLVVAAVNEALRKANEAVGKEMSGMLGGLKNVFG